MPTLDQEVDAIIAEEHITNENPANEDAPASPPPANDEDNKPEDKKDEEPVEPPKPGEVVEPEKKPDEPTPMQPVTKDSGPSPNEEPKEDDEQKPEEQPKEETPEEPRITPTEEVEQAKTLIGNLNLTEDQIFDANNQPKPFEDVVPPGAYFSSQLNPVKVTDKDGREHEFLLISDVEKQFPNGFEAKNNIEQMKFEHGILANESKWETAVNNYNAAKTQYNQEVSEVGTSREHNAQLGEEYVAMANQGLVPKLEGDVSESNPAVKEMDRILDWMGTKNAELAQKGLGRIDSLWVAKQLMDTETPSQTPQNAPQTQDKQKTITEQRRSVASLSNVPTSGGDKGGDKRPPQADIPMARYAEQIIAEENLR